MAETRESAPTRGECATHGFFLGKSCPKCTVHGFVDVSGRGEPSRGAPGAVQDLPVCPACGCNGDAMAQFKCPSNWHDGPLRRKSERTALLEALKRAVKILNNPDLSTNDTWNNWLDRREIVVREAEAAIRKAERK